MEISFNQKSYGGILKITADNVNIEEDVTKIIYAKLENGKPDFSKRIGREIDPTILDMLSSTLENLIYYGDAEYDSTRLIAYLFDKLPSDKIECTMAELNDKFVI